MTDHYECSKVSCFLYQMHCDICSYYLWICQVTVHSVHLFFIRTDLLRMCWPWPRRVPGWTASDWLRRTRKGAEYIQVSEHCGSTFLNTIISYHTHTNHNIGYTAPSHMDMHQLKICLHYLRLLWLSSLRQKLPL